MDCRQTLKPHLSKSVWQWRALATATQPSAAHNDGLYRSRFFGNRRLERTAQIGGTITVRESLSRALKIDEVSLTVQCQPPSTHPRHQSLPSACHCRAADYEQGLPYQPLRLRYDSHARKIDRFVRAVEREQPRRSFCPTHVLSRMNRWSYRFPCSTPWWGTTREYLAAYDFRERGTSLDSIGKSKMLLSSPRQLS